jgi:cytoskeletal protein CcmA (bactofilin family)
VDGQFEGVVESDFDLAVGLHGSVKGLVKARHIIITGSLEGKVVCEHLEILKGGKFIGEMIAGDMAIEAGGKFIGKSHELTESGQVVEFQPEEKRAVIENIVVVERHAFQPQEAQEVQDVNATETSSPKSTPPEFY